MCSILNEELVEGYCNDQIAFEVRWTVLRSKPICQSLSRIEHGSSGIRNRGLTGFRTGTRVFASAKAEGTAQENATTLGKAH